MRSKNCPQASFTEESPLQGQIYWYLDLLLYTENGNCWTYGKEFVQDFKAGIGCTREKYDTLKSGIAGLNNRMKRNNQSSGASPKNRARRGTWASLFESEERSY